MTDIYKLLNKCDRFMLTYNKNKTGSFYKIELTLKHRFFSSDEELLQEYDEFFKSANGSESGRGWKYSNEEAARSAYTWAVMKWDQHAT